MHQVKSRVPNDESALGTITERKREDGSFACLARARIMRDFCTRHETETSGRRPAAMSRIEMNKFMRTQFVAMMLSGLLRSGRPALSARAIRG